MLHQLQKIKSPLIKSVRGKGLFIGIEVDTKKISGRAAALKLIEHGILTKETHDTVIRLAPPLIITKQQIDVAINIIKQVFET